MYPSSISNSDPDPAGYRDDELVPLCPTAWTGQGRRIVGIVVLVAFAALVVGGTILEILLPRPAPVVIGREKARLDLIRSQANFSDGSLALQFEKDFRTRSALRHAVMPRWSGFLWSQFGEVDPSQLVSGKNGWLFQVHRLETKQVPDAQLCESPAASIAALSRRLAARGSQLILVPVPRKEEIYAHELRKAIYAVRPELYARWVQALRARGVTVVDLATAMRAHLDKDLYLRTDSHWSDPGIALAAEEVAQSAGLWKSESARTTIVEWLPKRPYPGDLLKMGGIIRPDGTGYASGREEVQRSVVLDRGSRQTRQIESAVAVGEAVLVGTSYSFNSFTFPAFLRHFTDLDWYIAAWPAIGPIEPLSRALDAIGAGNYPRTLVWEFPAYEVFCVDPELRGLSSSMQKIGPVPGIPLISIAAGQASSFAAGSALLPGQHRLSQIPIASFLPEHRLLQPGDGSVQVTLRGSVRNGTVRVGASTESGHWSTLWSAGTAEISLPLVGSTSGRKLHLSAGAVEGMADLSLESIEISTLGRVVARAKATPTETEAGTQSPMTMVRLDPPTPLTTLSLATVQIVRLDRDAYPLRVQFENGEGRDLLTMEIQSGTSEHSLVVNLAPFAGETLTAVRLQSGLPLPKGALREVIVTAP